MNGVVMKKLRSLVLRTDNSVASFLIRVSLGAVFFPHGAQKVLGWFGGHGLFATYGAFTEKMGIPAVFAVLAIAAEFLGSLGLLFGFCTRIAAFGIASVMTVAMTLHYHNGFFMNWSGKQAGEGIEYHLLAFAMAVYLVIRGGGALSLDGVIKK